jgi:hypothetical protein
MKLHEQLHVGNAPEGWTDVDGILMYRGRAFLLNSSSLWQPVLEHAHTIGHKGCEKRYIGCAQCSTTQQQGSGYGIMFVAIQFARKIRQIIFILSVFYSHCRYQLKYGVI